MLNDKDKNILLTTRDVDLNSNEYAYLGGVFGSNEEDFIEVLIHDPNQNLLETNIVDPSDYTYDENVGVKLKTGTILRKLGYDRGRYIVKYNFLRRKAGSHETILVDNNNEIFTGEFDSTNDIGRLGNDLNLKENKYLVHEISPSRNEIRIIPQRIKNEKYLRNFLNLGKKVKTYISDTDNAKIEFKNQNNNGKRNSKILGFENSNMKFSKDMVGGQLIIKNAFVRSYEYINPPPAGAGVPEYETINSQSAFVQARFRAEADNGSYKNNSSGNRGDVKQIKAFAAFKGTDGKGITDNSYPGSETALSNRMDTIGAHIRYKGNTVMNNIYDTHDADFHVIKLETPDGETGVEVTVYSISTLQTDGATGYTWELTGFDVDGGLTPNVDRITVRNEGDDSGGDVQIQTVSNPVDGTVIFATPNPLDRKTASAEILAADQRDGANRPRVAMRFKIFSGGARVGVKLTVTTDTSNRPSMIHIPCMFETKD